MNRKEHWETVYGRKKPDEVSWYQAEPTLSLKLIDQAAGHVSRSVKVGGHVLVATFDADGPTKCSGLDVARYSPDELHAQFGSAFRLLRSEHESHVTPWGAIQKFVYCVCSVEGPEHVRHAA